MRYTKKHRVVARVLLVSLLLESCGNLNTDIKLTQSTAKILPPNTELVAGSLLEEQEFKTRRGDKVIFYPKGTGYEAKVEGYKKQLAVVVIDDSLNKAAKIKNKEDRKKFLANRISLQKDKVIVAEQGLKSGMRRADKKGKKKEEAGREESENVLNSPSALTIKVNQGPSENRYVNRAGLKNERDILAILNDELEGHYQLGKAVDTGDCFFDALAQYMNIRNDTDVNTIAYLRRLCHDSYTKNKAEVDEWIQADYGGLDKGREEYYMVQYTQAECERDFNGRAPIWGRPWVEGRILTQQLDINKFVVIEVLEDAETGKPVASYHLVTKDSYNSIDAEVCKEIIQEEGIPVLVNGQSSLHYVPLLRAMTIPLRNREKVEKDNTKSYTNKIEGEKGEVDVIKQEMIAIAIAMLEEGDAIENILEVTELSREEIEDLDKARKEKERKTVMAKKLLKQGKGIDTIIKLTKLSQQDIEELQLTMIHSTTQTTTSTTSLPKVDLKSVVSSKEVVREDKIKNDLPIIKYPEKSIVEVLEEIPMSTPVQEQVRLYLENIKQKVNDIKRYLLKEQVKHFYQAIKEAMLEIKNTARLLYEHIQHCHTVLSNTLRSLILEAIAPLEKALDRKIELSPEDREALRDKTKRLYGQQSYIARNGDLQNKLMEHLAKVKELIAEKRKLTPCCYISYAWSSKENKAEEYWIQPFLSILYNHLSAAGIRVIMDIRDNQPGDSIYQFMKQYRDGNYIILVGTESLLQKHDSFTAHAVKTELSIISNRFEQDQKQFGNSRIYPLLVSGTNGSSFPEIYDKYRTVRDAREGNYIDNLRNLVDWIYSQQINEVREAYEKLWRELEEKHFQVLQELDIKQELSIDYHRKSLQHLKEDTQFQAVQAQWQVKHSLAVTSEIIGVHMKSQGLNPKGLYSAHGKQYQRPSITSDFVERQKLWNKIVAHFDKSDQQVLTLTAHGMGGMGKTELARYYYLNPPRPYTLRAWFNAESLDQLYASYLELAKENGITYPENMSILEKAILVRKWLGQQKDCLLVYDNVPGAKHLEGLLPEEGKHHILITSRNEVEWPAHQKLDIDVMEEQEAIDLICKITGCSKEHPKLSELVNKLGRLPLALAQAGAYIAEKKTSIEDYLVRYHKYQEILLSDKKLVRNPKHEPVWITFDMNFKALEEACPSAISTLQQASLLAASDIPEALLKSMVEGNKDNPADLLWDDIKRHIGRYSLMRIDSESKKLSMHRLVQDILRHKQNQVESREVLNQISASIKSIYPHPENNDTIENDVALARLFLPHIAITIAYSEKYFNEKECTDFNLEHILGRIYQTLGNYTRAEKYYHTSLLINQKKYEQDRAKMGEAMNSDSNLPVAISLNAIGGVYYYLGRYQKALEYYNKALEITRSLYTGSDSNITNSLISIGHAYAQLGEYTEAKKYYKQALEMHQDVYKENKEHPTIVNLFNGMGIMYQNLGKNLKALQYFEKALKMSQALYTSNHPTRANLLNGIGQAHKDLGEYSKALSYVKQALAIQQAIYIDSHPNIANSLNNMGNIYKITGKYPKALSCMKRGLKIIQNIYISNHPEVATALNNIGGVYKDLGEYLEALKYYNQSLAMRLSVHTDSHPDLANSFNNIGVTYFQLGEYQEALIYYQKALAIQRNIYKGNNPYIYSSLVNIGKAYCYLGSYEESLKCLHEALEIGQAIYANNHPNVAFSLDNIGEVYKALSKYPEALEYHKQAFIIRKTCFKDNHPDIAKSLNNIGMVYQALDQNQEALKYYQQALEMYQNVYKENTEHPAIKKVRENVEQLQEIKFNIKLAV